MNTYKVSVSNDHETIITYELKASGIIEALAKIGRRMVDGFKPEKEVI